MNKQQLANKIWESANKMRSKIEANEYKDYILGFIFYKYLSDQEVRYLKSEDCTEEDMVSDLNEENEKTVGWIRNNLGYFIAYDDLFSTWIKKGKDFSIDNVSTALSAFSRNINPSYKNVYEGIFDTLQSGLTKLGDSTGSRTKAASDLIQLIREIPMDGKQDYDVLGFVYEYLISNFAANAGKKAGEFYTPHEVSLLMSEIIAYHLRDRKKLKIYDPTSGSGSLLINIGKAAEKYIGNSDCIIYYAQELKQNTYNLTRMNMIMRGIRPDNLKMRNGDTLEKDWPYKCDPENTTDPLRVDAVVSNPPYSQHWDPTGKENDLRYSYGIAPKTKADYAFLLHDLYHLDTNGIMAIVLPHGVLFRGGEEGEIRKNLIENKHIEAIIGLPSNIFFGTGIPTIIMVLRQDRENTDVLVIDASKGFEKVGKNNKLRASDIKRISDTVSGRLSIPKYSRLVSREEIRANDYNLNIPRYVDSSEKAESWDIHAIMFGGIPAREIDELDEYWGVFPGLKDSLFRYEGMSAELSVSDVTDAVKKHADLKRFREGFHQAFKDYDEFLKEELLNNKMSVSISGEEERLSEDLFERLENVPLIDRYEAYQILDDTWRVTSADLEIIQTEGYEAIRKVDPLMVLKNKNGDEQEVQNGWEGRVIPFDLVQKTILRAELDELNGKKSRLDEIISQYAEIFDSLSEDDKVHDTVNEERSVFVNAKVSEAAKKYRSELKAGSYYDEDSYESKIIKVDDLIAEEKSLKKEIKSDGEKLTRHTIDTVENLSDDQIEMLLYEKWIKPIEVKLFEMPENLVGELCKKVKALSEKYAVTYPQIEDEIAETSKSLSAMIEKLTGSEYDMEGLNELKKRLGGM